MSHCVPSWDLDENLAPPRLPLRSQSNSESLAPDVPLLELDYEVAELTWENGQLSLHGLGPPRLPNKPPGATASSPSKYAWDKPCAGGTLESIVDQATCFPQLKSAADGGRSSADNELVPWFDHHHRAAAAASATMTMDALVPCSKRAQERTGTCEGSCSGANTVENNVPMKRSRVARVPVAAVDWSSKDNSVSGSASFGRDSWQLTLDTPGRELGVCGGFTSTSTESPGNTSSDKQCTKDTTDDYDSVCHVRSQRGSGKVEGKRKAGKSSISTKRSRAAAVHNQSERKRRDKINQRMKTLQKMVPNSSKTDKASMLDEVIEYLKQLQAQVQMMSRMNMSSMMLPMTLQQQLQLSMMAPMGMGMGVMDLINTIGRPNVAGIPPLLHPSAYMPQTSWDVSGGDRLSAAPWSVIPDPMSTFLACQSQPMTMEAYSRMAALYQQLHQPQPLPPSGSRN